jgi:hypothetical protein
MYDGSLGIICAISALKVLNATGKLQRLTKPVEVRYSIFLLFPLQCCYHYRILSYIFLRAPLVVLVSKVTILASTLYMWHDVSHASYR